MITKDDLKRFNRDLERACEVTGTLGIVIATELRDQVDKVVVGYIDTVRARLVADMHYLTRTPLREIARKTDEVRTYQALASLLARLGPQRYVAVRPTTDDMYALELLEPGYKGTNLREHRDIKGWRIAPSIMGLYDNDTGPVVNMGSDLEAEWLWNKLASVKGAAAP